MEYKRPIFILSYPRSGFNWTRYIIEHIYPKPGKGQNYEHAHILTSRTAIIHSQLMTPDYDKKLIFCLRDYRECIIRNSRKYEPVPVIDNSKLTWEELIDIDHAKNKSDPGGTMFNYMVNLKIFDECKGDKFLVRYEDMMSDPVSHITELAWFLCVLPGEFLVKLPWHQNNSINESHNRHGSYTRGETARHHQNLMSAEHIQLLDEKIKSFNPKLYEKYLNTYRS